MTQRMFSLLFLITYPSNVVSGSDYLSIVAGGRKYINYAHSRSVSTEYLLYCRSEPGCVCNQEGDGYVLHCEKEVHARMSLIAEKNGNLDLKCNATLPSGKLRHDYYLTMSLGEFEEARVQMTACPEPPESYASLFASSSLLSHSEQIPRISFIKILVIDCGLREQFSITKEHFEGLNGLQHLELSCEGLRELPDDLFKGKFPNLLHLNISNTTIESIPDSILTSLPNLQQFILYSNRIVEIRSGNFKDAASLRFLLINEPLLKSLGNDVFNHTPNLEIFSLQNTSVTVLPRSLGKLVNLSSISLAANKIEYIEKEHCVMWEKMSNLIMMDNELKRVDFECFFNFENLSSVIITRTSLSNLPDKPMKLNNLRKLVFSKNTLTISRASRFITSETLDELVMDSSNIKSFDHDFLHSSPNLRVVILNNNGFSFLHEDFFSVSRNLTVISLKNNKLAAISPNFFNNNPNLKILLLTDNVISDLSSSLLANCSSLFHLCLGGNNLKELPNKFLSNLDKLQVLNISNNKISKLEHDCFTGLSSLNTLDLSNNILEDSKMTSFRELENSKALYFLNLYGNSFSLIPSIHITSLQYLNLSNNVLSILEVTNFRHNSKLKILDLSRNALKTMSRSVFLGFGHLITLDLSFNQLTEIPDSALRYAQKLQKLLLSGNKIRKFNICIIANNRNLEELDLSGNGLHSIGDYSSDCDSEITSLKKLDLSNNEITFTDSNWIFDKDRKTWGSISPLIYFPNIEEIILANNSISMIFMDWRNMLVNLRNLDLQYNKIKYLTHQDMLFPTTILHTDGRREPLKCSHSLQVDLRHNLITGMELPKNMLAKRRRGESFANVTMMMEDNPFNCGCGVINVLRLFDGDVVLTSELRRTEDVNWISPAKIDPGNLSC
ncbi:hypothetical protein J437_LFUL003648, partial [Ladona fulva]